MTPDFRKLTIARRALEKIAAFDDRGASEYLARTGKYTYFDEPSSVRTARKALRNIAEVDQEKKKC